MSAHPGGELYVPNELRESDRAYLERQTRYGNRVGWGDTPAVLVVDMTVSFLEERRTEDDCLAATETVVDGARSADVPVFYTVPADPSLPAGYPATIKASPSSERGPDRAPTETRKSWIETIDRIAPPLDPRDDEPVIEKPRASAFFDTHLSNMLHYYDVDTLVVCGMTTSGCVRATVVDSHSSNFRTIVPAECVGDAIVASHQLSLFDIDTRYGDVTSVDAVLSRLEATAESAADPS